MPWMRIQLHHRLHAYLQHTHLAMARRPVEVRHMHKMRPNLPSKAAVQHLTKNCAALELYCTPIRPQDEAGEGVEGWHPILPIEKLLHVAVHSLHKRTIVLHHI